MADAYEIADKITELAGEISSQAGRLYSAIDNAVAYAEPDCDREHCDDDWSCTCPQPNVQAEEVWEIGREYLRMLRSGYTLDVTPRDVLEEMERTVRE